MIKLYIYCSVLIIGNVEVGPDIGLKFHQEVMEIVSYDNDTRGHTLPELPDARSNTICTEHGTHVSRNHIDLKQTDAPFEPKTETQPVSKFAKSKHAPTTVQSSANVKHDNKAKLIWKRVDVRKCNSTNSTYTTCSGCISKPATRLITQM